MAEPAARLRVRRVLGSAELCAFAALSAAGFAAIAWFAVAWVTGGWGAHPLILLVLSGLLLMLGVNQQGRWLLLLPMRRPEPMPAPAGLRVAVVTTFVPGVESLEMLEATLAAMQRIRYPHDTWLLDEGDDPEAAALCRRLGVRHFSRRHRSEYQAPDGAFRARTKHGNYNAWLHAEGYARYEVLAAFDPDHVPQPEFLDRTIGYLADTSVGYVQAAQAYYNQAASLVARGAAEETYAYFSAVQMASYGMGYPIIVGGHNVHRVAALQAVGGFAVHDADDLLLTMRYRAAGWQGVYHPEIIARGLTPVDWQGYLVQQRRWARSVLDLKFRHGAGYATALPIRTRLMSYLHGLNFLHRSLAHAGVLACLLLLLLLGGTLPVLSTHLVAPSLALLVALGAQELFRQRFYLDRRRESGMHWCAGMLGFAKWPWFLLALADAAANRRLGYVVTQKARSPGAYRPFVAWNAFLAATLVGTWLWATLHGPVPVALGIGALGGALATAFLAIHGARRPPPPWSPLLAPRPAGRSEVSVPAEASS